MLSQYQDGMICTIPIGHEVVQSRGDGHYLELGRAGNIFTKRPKPHHYMMMQKLFGFGGSIFLLKTQLVGMAPIRKPYPEERPRSLAEMCKRFPEFRNESSSLLEIHFLVLYKLQFLRLKEAFGDGIPDASFVFLEDLQGEIRPAVVQETIDGSLITDIVARNDRGVSGLKEEWKSSAKTIAKQLAAYIDSDCAIDFNFLNFMFAPEMQRLFYVDNKPPFVRTRRMNEHNKRILWTFLVDPFL